MDFHVSVKTYSVKHVLMRCEGNVEDIRKCLNDIVPKLHVKLVTMLLTASTEEIAEARESGPKLWRFEERDHGSLLAAEGREAKAYQIEIGNPLTAESMTRNCLSAALYAPLRVLLFEDSNGVAFFEYDLPSTLFGQFGVEPVNAVGLELDRELEVVLAKAVTDAKTFSAG